MDPFLQMNTLLAVARQGSLTHAARELEVTIAMVSKRINALEKRLGVRLLVRTTRNTYLTPEGERYAADCRRILDDLQETETALATTTTVPEGLVRVSTTTGFGRRILTPLLVSFGQQYPKVHIQLGLADALVDVNAGGFDLAIRFGPLADSQLTSIRLARNQRVLVASPSYLNIYGRPVLPSDLLKHNCIVLKESSQALLSWKFVGKKGLIEIPVRGNISTDSGDLQHELALVGAGVSMKSIWDVAQDLVDQRLEIVLPEYACLPADIYAVFLHRHFQPARVRVFVNFIKKALAELELSKLIALNKR